MKPKDQTGNETPVTRLPYEAPAVVSEEVFETLALQCSKADRGLPDRCGTVFNPGPLSS